MPKNSHTEVLVVGAGPVGLLTALLLTRQGVSTRIIDEESRAAAHGYACALHPASLGLLENAGVADQVIDLGRRVKMLGLFEGHERRARIGFAGLPGPYPFAVALEQSMLENLLEQELRNAGARVEWNHRLLELKQRDHVVETCVENLALPARDYSRPKFDTESGDRKVIQADFVIGADGHHSTVRQQLGIGMVRIGAPQLFAVFEMETAEPVDHVMKLVLDKSAISVHWPLAENRCRWSFQITPAKARSDFPRKDRERLMSYRQSGELAANDPLRRLLEQRAPWFPADGIRELNWCMHVQFERQMAQNFGQGRCWLAGDAAHQTSPAGMQSMNRGLMEGADLAGKIFSILRGKSGLEMLRNYDNTHVEEWRRLLGLHETTDRPHSFATWARRHFASLLGTNVLTRPPRSFPSWARHHFGTILRSLPATGEDLNHLLKQI